MAKTDTALVLTVDETKALVELVEYSDDEIQAWNDEGQPEDHIGACVQMLRDALARLL